jgi:hypothetical protein
MDLKWVTGDLVGFIHVLLASKDIEFNEEISGDDDTEPAKSKVFTDRKDLPASLIDLEQLQEANH